LLKEIQSRLPEITRLKTQVIAISPETPNQINKTKERNNLSFHVISDNDGSIARELNLLFKVEDAVAQEYEHLGISLKQAHGNDRNEFPVPATYIIDSQLKIHYAFIDLDYTKRASLEDLLKILTKIQ
jgi:peroxiredoxin